MEDVVNALEDFSEQRKVGDAATDKLGGVAKSFWMARLLNEMFDVLQFPSGKVIKDDNLVSSPDQLLNKVRADESRSAGNNYPFHPPCLPLRLGWPVMVRPDSGLRLRQFVSYEVDDVGS